jgi:tRNA dimethylallyltransferase
MTGEPDIPVLIIFGPTASGKTSLASSLFSSDNPTAPFPGLAEIISADSMQVYRGMDIGTAKPSPSFIERLPHHLIDIKDPSEQFCAGDFVRLADSACNDIYSRGKLPVVLGGTAFYVKNFLYGLPVTPESDPEVRRFYMERMKNEGAAVLFRELEAVDPESAGRINIHDEYRIIRALEVFSASGQPLSSYNLSQKRRDGYRYLVIALDRSREELYERINLRVEEMFADGLEGEVQTLVAKGYTVSDPGMQAIGYREFFSSGTASRSDILAQIQLDSRKYAKRQETFIRSIPDILHFDADDLDGISKAVRGFYAT